MKKKLPKIVIFGRTNVGKSRLFNCLTEKHQALVSGIEGTTRDSNIGKFEWQGKEFELIDTGGIIDTDILKNKKITGQDIDTKVQKQAREYLKQADVILFLVDVKSGILPQDKVMSAYISKRPPIKTKTILVANKADSPKLRHEIAEFNKLCLGDPIAISAATGSGTGDLLDIIAKKFKSQKTDSNKNEEPEAIKVSIIGKPNVGKSSLLNSLIGYERVIVSDEAHTTREPQDTDITYKDNLIRLIDTAGISRKGKKTRGLEKDGIEKTLGALKRSDVALLVIDINEGITHQDSKLVEEIIDRQASLIIIANKWDLIEDKNTKEFTQYIYNHFPFVTWAPIHFASAKTGNKIPKILDIVLEISENRKRKDIGDSQLNKFLNKLVKIQRPMKGSGPKYPRIYQLSMTGSNPPVFGVRIGPRDTLDNSYVRFIENRLREKFNFIGTPIKIFISKGRVVHGAHEKPLLKK